MVYGTIKLYNLSHINSIIKNVNQLTPYGIDNANVTSDHDLLLIEEHD